MKGDFSRNTFKASHHFSRVFMQQGRVQLDADWNEQTAILLHYLRTLAADLIGPHGGPEDSFKIYPCVNENKEIRDENGNLLNCAGADHTSYDRDFYIFKGHYYVNGILCENENVVRYSRQDDYSAPGTLDNGQYLVYLDVWERHSSHIETDEPIREVALGGPDTATRAKVIWQVKVEPLIQERLTWLQRLAVAGEDNLCQIINGHWHDVVARWWQPENRGTLQALAKVTAEMDLEEPCIMAPESRYRGAENQLYRVEIHQGGEAGSATYKWSRENGAVIFPITDIAGQQVSLAHLGRDGRFSLQEGDWVEMVDDDVTLHNQVNPLRQVVEIDRIEMVVTLDEDPGFPFDKEKHPLLRRWDHKADTAVGGKMLEDGAVPIVEDKWLHLEDGVQIYFKNGGNSYRTGDYWLIPARTATGDVEWPQENDSPRPLPPQGVHHHYAPLAIIDVAGGNVTAATDCRLVWDSIANPPA